MFLPLEGLIQMALDKQADLMEYAWQKNDHIRHANQFAGA
jgi:DNA anti-recombination protein RmuC